MRTRDEKIGNKIIEILFQNEPNGMGFREICRKTQYSKRTIERWINFFRESDIIVKTPKYPLRLERDKSNYYQKGISIIPDDPRKKTLKNRNKLSLKYKKGIFLILSIAAFGETKKIKTKKIEFGNIKIQDPSNPDKYTSYKGKSVPGVAKSSVIDRLDKFIGSIYRNGYLPDIRINFGNDEIFGYLRLSKNDVDTIFDYLLTHNPPYLESLDTKIGLEKRYKIKDILLDEFVKECIFVLNMHVFFRWDKAYLLGLMTGKYKEYREWMEQIYGTSRKIYEKFSYLENRKKDLLELSEEDFKKLQDSWVEQIKIHDRDSRIKRIFGNEGIKTNDESEKKLQLNQKFELLKEKYPEVIEISNILFPKFIREEWK